MTVAFKPECRKPHLHSVTLPVQFAEWKTDNRYRVLYALCNLLCILSQANQDMIVVMHWFGITWWSCLFSTVRR